MTAQNFICSPDTCKTGYHWQVSGPLNGSGTGNSFAFTFTLPGTYGVILTPQCGSQMCEPCKFTILVTDPIVIRETDFDGFRYAIVPNPNSGKFTLRITSAPMSNFVVKLINAVGQVIEAREIKYVSADHRELFDVTSVGKGIYLLVITNDKAHMVDKILVE